VRRAQQQVANGARHQDLVGCGPSLDHGEIALLAGVAADEEHRTATVTADTDLWVAVLSIREFRTVLAEFPAVADAVRRAARDRLVAIAR
jgi:CRP-like cAMP-binding protein